MSSLEYQTDLTEVIKERVAKIDANVGHAGLVSLMSRILGEGHKTAVETMRARPHSHNTGETEKFEMTRLSPLSGKISAMSKIVGYLEWGTGIYGPMHYPIQATHTPANPARGAYLRFKGMGGEYIFRKWVAGIQPQHNIQDRVLPAENKMLVDEVDAACLRAVS
jgi:hypothetical protein